MSNDSDPKNGRALDSGGTAAISSFDEGQSSPRSLIITEIDPGGRVLINGLEHNLQSTEIVEIESGTWEGAMEQIGRLVREDAQGILRRRMLALGPDGFTQQIALAQRILDNLEQCRKDDPQAEALISSYLDRLRARACTALAGFEYPPEIPVRPSPDQLAIFEQNAC